MPFLAPLPDKKLFEVEHLKANGTTELKSAPDAVASLEAKVNGT